MSHQGCGCPGSMARTIEREEVTSGAETGRVPSALRQWPVQLQLVPPTAPYFQDAEILVAADCVAFAMGSFHQELLPGKAIAIACPKLDETDSYVQKLAAIFTANNIRSITVAIMEVPCCRGLDVLVRQALAVSGKPIPLETVVIGVNGERRE